MKTVKIILIAIVVAILLVLAGYGAYSVGQLAAPYNTIFLGGAFIFCVVGIALTYQKKSDNTYVLEKICPECGESLYLTYDLPEDESEPRIYYYACDGCEYSEEITMKLF